MVGADTGMISDRTELERSQDAWEFVRESRNLIVGNCNVATFVVGFNQAGVRDICFNLLLASAFSVSSKYFASFVMRASLRVREMNWVP